MSKEEGGITEEDKLPVAQRVQEYDPEAEVIRRFSCLFDG
jgi:hypothetical protein